MILKHQSLSLYGKPIFSWVDLDTPTSEELPIPSVACFTYFIKGDDQVLDAEHEVVAHSEHAILSLCGMTLGKMMTAQEGRLHSLIVHFQPEVLQEIYKDSKPPYWQEIEAPVTKYVVQMAASRLVRHFMEGVTFLFENREAVTEDILVLKLKEIILLLMQTDSMPEVLHIIRSLFSERTFSFKETIEAYLYTQATVQDLANLTNTSLSTFKREFAKIYGTTPASYILDRRLEKVAQLLRVSDDPVSAIGYDCGFTTPAHLTRVFKTKFQKTPTQYRLDLTVN